MLTPGLGLCQECEDEQAIEDESAAVGDAYPELSEGEQAEADANDASADRQTLDDYELERWRRKRVRRLHYFGHSGLPFGRRPIGKRWTTTN